MIFTAALAWADDPPALLVGVRNERGGLSTWWVTADGLEQLAPTLVWPDEGGFWRAQVIVHDVGRFHGEDVLVTGPGGERVPPPFSVAAAAWSGVELTRVTGAGQGWLALETARDTTDGRGVSTHVVTTGARRLRPDATEPPPPPPAQRAALDGDAELVVGDGAVSVLRGGEVVTAAAVRGAALVFAAPVPPGVTSTWRAAVRAPPTPPVTPPE